MYEKSKAACFTGKRPQSMLWGFNEADERCVQLKHLLKCEVETAIKNGYEMFVSGFALGVDIWAAEIVIDLKKEYPQIRIEAAIPFEEQANNWSEKDRERYFDLLPQCDIVTYVNKRYTPACMMERNRYMVDKSSLVIAVYNNTSGGTGATIKYARACGHETKVIEF
jgi:uncharacterized phage-like protein YoqJ